MSCHVPAIADLELRMDSDGVPTRAGHAPARRGGSRGRGSVSPRAAPDENQRGALQRRIAGEGVGLDDRLSAGLERVREPSQELTQAVLAAELGGYALAR